MFIWKGEKAFHLTAQYKNTSNPIFKNGQNLENDILPKRIYKWIINTQKCPTSLIITGVQIKTIMHPQE